MSHEALNGEQFADHVHPNMTLAIPGMEHLSHPWAGPLSKGYHLDIEHSDTEHHLAAVDVSHPKYPTVAAELSWAKRDKKGYEPGEVTMVENLARGEYSGPHADERARGLAGALFHSAHRWNFGQETVPIHSTERSMSGERFANRVRPDLKPDVWHLTGASYDKEVRAPGKPDWAPAEWPDKPDDLHPFEKERTAARKAAEAKSAASRQIPGQGRLFDPNKYGKRKR